jgi:hypothetical protein
MSNAEQNVLLRTNFASVWIVACEPVSDVVRAERTSPWSTIGGSVAHELCQLVQFQQFNAGKYATNSGLTFRFSSASFKCPSGACRQVRRHASCCRLPPPQGISRPLSNDYRRCLGTAASHYCFQAKSTSVMTSSHLPSRCAAASDKCRIALRQTSDLKLISTSRCRTYGRADLLSGTCDLAACSPTRIYRATRQSSGYVCAV